MMLMMQTMNRVTQVRTSWQILVRVMGMGMKWWMSYHLQEGMMMMTSGMMLEVMDYVHRLEMLE